MPATDQPTAQDVPLAVVVTCDPELAQHLADLHPAVKVGLLTRLAGVGTLSDGDALLLLSSPTAGPLESTRTVSRTVYIGRDLDDAEVWARAVKLHAAEVLHTPDQDEQIRQLIASHVQACTGVRTLALQTVIPAPQRQDGAA